MDASGKPLPPADRPAAAGLKERIIAEDILQNGSTTRLREIPASTLIALTKEKMNPEIPVTSKKDALKLLETYVSTNSMV